MEDAKAARELLPAESHTRSVLDQAIDVAVLHMTVPIFRSRSAIERAFAVLMVFLVGLVFAGTLAILITLAATSNGEATKTMNAVTGIAAMTIYVFVATVVMVSIEGHFRDQFVYEQLMKIAVVVETPEIARARAYRRRKRKLAAWLGKFEDKRWRRARSSAVRRMAKRKGLHANERKARIVIAHEAQ